MSLAQLLLTYEDDPVDNVLLCLVLVSMHLILPDLTRTKGNFFWRQSTSSFVDLEHDTTSSDIVLYNAQVLISLDQTMLY